VDRISEKIAYLYNPLNLAVLRMLRMVVETAERNNTPISICGEMAGEPKYAMLLIGLGFRVFSMGPAYMNQVKRIIRSVSAEECRRLVDELLASEKTDEIESKMHAIITEKFPWVTL